MCACCIRNSWERIRRAVNSFQLDVVGSGQQAVCQLQRGCSVPRRGEANSIAAREKSSIFSASVKRWAGVLGTNTQQYQGIPARYVRTGSSIYASMAL